MNADDYDELQDMFTMIHGWDWYRSAFYINARIEENILFRP